MLNLTEAQEHMVNQAAWCCARYVEQACLTRDDLRQQGREMLLRVLSKRDPSMSEDHFGAYCRKRVMGAMMDHIRANWRKELTNDGMDETRISACNPVRRAQLVEAFNAADKLSENDKQVALMLMDGNQGKEAAKAIGRSDGAISQAKERLRRFFSKYVEAAA